MGENDPGAAPGVSVTNTVDIAGTNNLRFRGPARYTNDVAAIAASRTGSSFAINFTNGAYATNAVVSTATDNFGIECWVKPTQTSSNQVIAYNGITGGAGDGGWGLIIDGNNHYGVLFGGVTAFGTNVATANVWTHLALVCDNGNSTLYINGVGSGSVLVSPGVPSGNFALAAVPQSPTNFFNGLIDEVRVFTFAPGQFSTNDLLWNQNGAVITLPPTAISSTSAQLKGTLNPNGVDTTAWFQYGTTTNYGSFTPSTFVSGTNAAAVSISDVVSGLNSGTTYYFSLVGSNAIKTAFGANLAFTTPPAVGINGQSASSISPTSAVLNATVTVNGADSTVWFEYGPTTNYGNSTASTTFSGTILTPIPFSIMVSQLSQGTIYHFQLVGTNIDGTSYGGDQTFTTLAFVQSNTPLPGLSAASLAWGDFDNDGLMDILLCGYNGTNPVTQVWRNTGSGFININAGLPGVDQGSVAWGDFDNDGRLDILLCGLSNSLAITQVWRNTGSGFSNINAGLPGIDQGSVAWGDYDNDGRLDILLCGYDDFLGIPITQVWRNTGNGFSNINAGLPGVDVSSVAWGDYDNDGRLDILLCGDNGSGPITQVWRNTGNGFTNINAGLPGVEEGLVAWGDYDSDGRLDILLCGFTESAAITQVWRNTGNGFAEIQDLPGVANGAAVAWADYYNDGRLDFLISGYIPGSSLATQLWLNQIPTTNSRPTAPSSLSMALLGSSLTLSWKAASDLQTPVSGLSYNLRVGTSPGGSDILAPMANTSGMRLVPQRGNFQSTQLTLQLPSPPAPGTTFYCSVQSIDTSFAGSPFAPEASFLLRPSFTSSGMRSDGTFQAQFDVQSGTNYTIQASTDLVHWVDLLDFTFGSSGPFLFTDPDSTNYPHRFYRFGQH
jgi:hypothetical protein